MWLPAVLLLVWGVLAAAGIPLVPRSNAVSTGTATVNATVALDIHIAGTCAANTNFPSVALNVGNNSLATCGVTFGTNNGATSTLKINHPRAAGNLFCQAASVSAACGAGTFTSPAANAAALAGGEFGIQTTAVTSCTTPSWNNTKYNPVPASGAPATICSMTGTADGNYSLDFVANRAVGTVAGTYLGEADFSVQAT